VHCGECPSSYNFMYRVNSTLTIGTVGHDRMHAASRSNACSVSYVQEVEVGTDFTCETVLFWSESKSFPNLLF
jgi:hypothetical protein